MLGFFPPSSSDNFLNIGAAVLAISSPVLVPPVNEMALTSLCATIAAPTFGPRPWTIFNTPGGNPASMHSLESMKAVIGVISLGFATTVQPAANAGATFHVNRYRGKFHGEMHPTRPEKPLERPRPRDRHRDHQNRAYLNTPVRSPGRNYRDTHRTSGRLSRRQCNFRSVAFK